MADNTEFKLERYKYILKQIHFLNENTYKYLIFFQGLAALILGGVMTVFLNWKKLSISPETAQLGIYGLLCLLVLFAFFVILYMLLGVISWFDYRKEEVKLLDEVVGAGYRSKPTLKNCWRWRETWLIISIMVFVGGVSLATLRLLVPLIV